MDTFSCTAVNFRTGIGSGPAPWSGWSTRRPFSAQSGRNHQGGLEFWREEDMVEFLPSPVGVNPGELLPVASAMTGEWVFLRVPDEPSLPWRVVVQEFDSPAWTLYEMTFGEWLLAYLRGEDVTVCSHLAPDRPFWEFLP
ncbi:hypothetical protein [Streptomyces peucetius]|uniref:SMI1/KNR4 family protein n=1 Tax=Streptomyces peucetius TaxID=1950 RepID=A0ABY6I155_STRPE|nr:hypothetical protein [Streptomyces peucetius]UYQ60703.1 hypothetical protein OGH68_03980 [Streptomyces peucetius]